LACEDDTNILLRDLWGWLLRRYGLRYGPGVRAWYGSRGSLGSRNNGMDRGVTAGHKEHTQAYAHKEQAQHGDERVA
jgi:hypothetical protein